MSDDDDVGYRKPPKRTQFKPGRSGNPKGRAKGQRNLKSDLTSILKKQVTIREDGEVRRVARQEAILLSLFERAMRGDVKATSQILAMLLRLEAQDPPEQAPAPVTDNDRAIVTDFLRRNRTSE